MASHIEGLGFPEPTTRLTTRLTTHLHESVLRLVAGVKSRDQVRASVPLAARERILAATCDNRGLCVAGSERALYHQVADRSGSGTAPSWVRIGWEEISNVNWNDREETLTLTGLLPTVARRTVLHLPTGASLGLLAHERVAWSALVSTEIQVREYGRARVIGRRRPGSEELTWLVGLDGISDTPDLQVALEDALHQLRARLGL